MNDDRFIRRPLSTAEHFLSFDATMTKGNAGQPTSVYCDSLYDVCFPEANLTTGVYRAVAVEHANKERARAQVCDTSLKQEIIYDFPVDVDALTGASLWRKSSKQLFACRNGVLALLYAKGSLLFRAPPLPTTRSSPSSRLVDSEPADDMLFDAVCLSKSGNKAAAATSDARRRRFVCVFQRLADGQFSLQTVAACRWLSPQTEEEDALSLCLSFGGSNGENVLLVGSGSSTGTAGLAIYSLNKASPCLEPVAVHRELSVSAIIPSCTSSLVAIVDKRNDVYVLDCANPQAMSTLYGPTTSPALVQWNEAKTNRLTFARNGVLEDVYVGPARQVEKEKEEKQKALFAPVASGFTPVTFHWSDQGRHCVVVEKNVADESKFVVQEYACAVVAGLRQLVAKTRVEVEDYFSSHVDGDALYVVLRSSETIRRYRLSTAAKKEARLPLQSLFNKHSTIR